MSVIMCSHCDERYDSDELDYCPRCIWQSDEFKDSVHSELEHGEECSYCGQEVIKPEVIAEKNAAFSEWTLNRKYKEYCDYCGGTEGPFTQVRGRKLCPGCEL